MTQIKFVVYAKPQPQGSMKGFVLPGKWGAKPRAILTSANPKMKPYRQELTLTAMSAVAEAGFECPLAPKHVPISLVIDFYLERPKSIPKRRSQIVVKPDLDKLIRSTTDAMTGILYQDDAQIIEFSVRKHYGVPERAEISACVIEDTLF